MSALSASVIWNWNCLVHETGIAVKWVGDVLAHKRQVPRPSHRIHLIAMKFTRVHLVQSFNLYYSYLTLIFCSLLYSFCSLQPALSQPVSRRLGFECEEKKNAEWINERRWDGSNAGRHVTLCIIMGGENTWTLFEITERDLLIISGFAWDSSTIKRFFSSSFISRAFFLLSGIHFCFISILLLIGRLASSFSGTQPAMAGVIKHTRRRNGWIIIAKVCFFPLFSFSSLLRLFPLPLDTPHSVLLIYFFRSFHRWKQQRYLNF